MKYLLSVMALFYVFCITTIANAKCVSENSGIYCDTIREAIQWTAQTEKASFVIDRNYKGLQPVTAKVQVHKTADSILTLKLAKRILDFYPTDAISTDAVYMGVLTFYKVIDNNKQSRLFLDVIGRHPDYKDCLQTRMWTTDNAIADLLSDSNDLLCVIDDNIILVTAPQ